MKLQKLQTGVIKREYVFTISIKSVRCIHKKELATKENFLG